MQIVPDKSRLPAADKHPRTRDMDCQQVLAAVAPHISRLKEPRAAARLVLQIAAYSAVFGELKPSEVLQALAERERRREAGQTLEDEPPMPPLAGRIA